MKGGNLSVCVSERAGGVREAMREEVVGGDRWRDEECVSVESHKTHLSRPGPDWKPVVGRPVWTLPAYRLVF